MTPVVFVVVMIVLVLMSVVFHMVIT
ncbi:uncharacterized protein METZ01_LOCUS321143, partial [marine metagenome]